MTGKINLNPMFIQPPQNEYTYKSFPLGCLIEGQYPSYFTGKEIPQKEVKEPEKKGDETGMTESKTPDEVAAKDQKADADLTKIESKGTFVATGKPAKICIIGSSALLKDNLLDTDGVSPNAAFVLNLIDSLNYREGIAVMRSKTQAYNPLSDTSVMTKNSIKLFNIAGLPVLTVIFGLIVLWLRSGRRKRIQMMFQ